MFWFKVILGLNLFSFVLGYGMYDNEFETNENIIYTKDKIEPQHKYIRTEMLSGTFLQHTTF